MHKFGVGADRPSMDPMERRRQRSVIKRKAINFTKIVSLVGIRHATDSKNSLVRRVIWILWLMFGTGFALNQIIERTQIYFQYLIRAEVQFITDKADLLFPQVTLCNDNPVPNVAKNVDAVLARIDDDYKKMKDSEKQNQREAREGHERSLKDNLEVLSRLTEQWEELSKNFSMNVSEAFVEATFGHDSAEAHEVLTDKGYCYTFSTREVPYHSSKGGSSNGLFFTLKLGHTKFEKYPGYKMLIHDPYVHPRFKGSSAVIELKAQTVTKVAITYEHIWYEGRPYYDCNDTDDYRAGNCLAGCDEKVDTMRCGCRDVYMKNVANTTLCSYGALLSCNEYNLANTNSHTTENSTSAKLDSCICDRECNTNTYKTSVTQMPSSSLGKDVLSVYVFYPSIMYTEANNVADYLFLDLLGDIGGALSLLLGATMLTVYEVCEFIVLVVKDYVLFKFFK